MAGASDSDRDTLLAEAERRLAAGSDGADLAAFLRIAFAHAAAEDLLEYDAAAIAAIARDAFAFFRTRSGPAAARVDTLPAADRSGRAHAAVDLSTANRPFIFDSVLGELQAAGLPVRLVVHPILDVARDAAGLVTAFAPPAASSAPPGFVRESFVHAHIPPLRDAATRSNLDRRLTSLMAEVVVVTDDWSAMRTRLRAAIEAFRADHPPMADAELEETAAFLQWLDAGNFVFLGLREYTFGDASGTPDQEPVAGSGLGLLRDPSVTVLRRGTEVLEITPEIAAFLVSSEPLIVSKANVRTRVHRRDYMDYVGVKVFRSGKVAGELRVVGLFTSSAFTQSAQSIPLMRRRVAEIIHRAGFDPASHSGKALLNILETYPRTELFQVDTAQLFDSAMAILWLEERPRVRALIRRDRFDRFVSVLVFVPRDRYNSDLRERMGNELARLYDGRVSAYFPDFSLLHLTRVQFIIGRNPGAGPDPTQGEVEAQMRAIVRSFDDDLASALDDAHAPEQASALLSRYGTGFGADYRARFTADDAVADIALAEGLSDNGIAVRFEAAGTPPEAATLTLHHLGEPIPLSRLVPILENLGFSVIEERTYAVTRGVALPLHRHEMLVERGDGMTFAAASADRLAGAVLAVWEDRAENDGFNALVLTAGLGWREAALLRTVARYLRQTALPYSIDYLWGALGRYPAVAALFVQRFAARFDPAGAAEAKERDADAALEPALDAVVSLDDDTILRAFGEVIRATMRTDFYATADASPAIALKINPSALAFVPRPHPFREIFVHSPEVEGVHLRFGPVARGGIRWSDRPQDFRTEVLGLVKAQIVKNAVIVPTGSKGGFVPGRLPAGGSREAVQAAGRAAYVTFIDRLLALTDDIDGEAVAPPADIVRHDGDDPYLVVAADKGTATFSDTANSIALKRGFWLGDAFASGGSAGYDHKAMGITARGAWEAVKRHFREMDVDIQTAPFTVAGVGDMSGDVFGNGMLLSHATKLVAAFDHRDIFIDPQPDPDASFAERQRLFALPRSSWQDYDRALISEGGGVFSRAEKEIALSPEARAAVGLEKASARPAEVLSAILRAPVDLLWFGGIGTYVRAPEETNAEVGDKANDALRVAADEVRAKVVGEGANLGMTPRARVAYALKGGRCNSDAIDNSAGVNTSDVEVNIKIALGPAIKSGALTEDTRLELLRAMTDEVAALVLRNNTLQTLALSLEERRGVGNLGNQLRLMAELEERGLLDRAVEQLPSDAAIGARAVGGKGLTRPEIGTLLAFAKLGLSRDLAESDVADDPYLSRELVRYFPAAMRERFADGIAGHRLRREIIATQLANSIVNRGGPTLPLVVRDRTGAPAASLARAYAVARDSFGLQALHAEIDALDNRVPGALQLECYAIVRDIMPGRVSWFVRNLDLVAGLEPVIGHYRAAMIALAEIAPKLLSPDLTRMVDDTAARLTAGGVPDALAKRLAMLPILARSLDVVTLADAAAAPLADAAVAYAAVGGRLGLAPLTRMLGDIQGGDYYEGLALEKAKDTLEAAHRDLARGLILAGSDGGAWEAKAGGRIQAAAEQLRRITADPRPTVAKASVAASLLAEVAR